MRKYDGRMRIYLTLACNLKCPFCVNRAVPDHKAFQKLPAETWAKIIRDSRRNVVLTGGEPFLYPELIKLVNMIDRKQEVRVYSNLTLPVDDFVRYVKRPVYFMVSYHPGGGSLSAFEDIVRRLAVRKDFRGNIHAIDWKGQSNEVRRLHAQLKALPWPFNIEADQKVQFSEMSSHRHRRKVRCSNKNILVAPDGVRYPCVSTLLRGLHPQEALTKEPLRGDTVTIDCTDWGYCAACDGLTERKLEWR